MEGTDTTSIFKVAHFDKTLPVCCPFKKIATWARGLEIKIAETDASEKSEAVMKRLKQLITENKREPNANKFEDCTEQVLQELTQQDESGMRNTDIKLN